MSKEIKPRKYVLRVDVGITVSQRKPCNPTCRNFICLKKALRIIRRGKNVVAWCTWVNDFCQGGKCKFAGCKAHALLPDGTCGIEMRKEVKVKDIVEEAMKMDKEAMKIKDKLKKLGRGIELEY